MANNSGSSLDLGDSSTGRSSALSRYGKLRSMGTSGDRPAALFENNYDSPGGGGGGSKVSKMMG